jgi:DNA invertase Pin-like site-specific DNA recombinase
VTTRQPLTYYAAKDALTFADALEKAEREEIREFIAVAERQVAAAGNRPGGIGQRAYWEHLLSLAQSKRGKWD